jgi:hypothetical protein
VVPPSQHKDRVEVSGTKGSLSFSIFSFESIRLHLEGEEESFSSERPEHIQMPLIRSVLEDLRGIGVCPSTGSTGAVTSQVMDQICGLR